MELSIVTPQEASLLAIGNASVEIAGAIKIDSTDMLEAAAEELREIVSKKKQLTEQRLSITRPIDDAKGKIMDLYRKPIELLEQAEGMLKRGISDFQNEQRRIAQEEQRRLDTEAAAERARLEAAARKATAEANALAQSDSVEDAGRAAEAQSVAEALHTQAAMTTTNVVQHEVTKVAGISERQNWKFEITDISQLPAEYLLPNEKAIGQVVRALKDKTNIPGVRAFAESSVSARRAA